MKYSFWDIMILYSAVLAGIFAALELLLFFLFWAFIFYQRNLEFVPFMIRYYSAIQLIDNPGSVLSLVCVAISLIRYTKVRSEGTPDLKRMRRNLLIVSLISSLLSLAHLLTWSLWPWVYW
jgi:hypothetical protein